MQEKNKKLLIKTHTEAPMKVFEDSSTLRQMFGLTKKKKKKKDNSKKNDMFLNCRSCKIIITNDYRSTFDKRYCADCL
jgi:hypothetical protein